MSAVSRDNRAALRRDVEAQVATLSLAIAEEVLAVATLLASDKSLRTALADAGQPVAKREALLKDLLGSRVQATTVSLLLSAISARWSDADELLDAVEELGAVVAFCAAENDGTLDRVEEELFRFGRAVEANPSLQMTLTDPALAPAGKAAVVKDLVAATAAPATTSVLTHIAANLRGRRVDAAVGALSNLAAAQRDRIVAQVRVAIELDAAQRERMARALSRLAGREVRLNIAVDPSVVGGASVRIGDDVIDGTMVTRLTQARRTLVG